MYKLQVLVVRKIIIKILNFYSLSLKIVYKIRPHKQFLLELEKKIYTIKIIFYRDLKFKFG